MVVVVADGLNLVRSIYNLLLIILVRALPGTEARSRLEARKKVFEGQVSGLALGPLPPSLPSVRHV